MKSNQAAHSIATLCRVLGVSPSGYYAWQQRSASARAQEDQELLTQIQAFHRRSRGTYGAPRIHRDLRAAGVRVSRKRVARVLKQAGLQGVSRRKWPVTTVRAEHTRPAPDLVQRAFTAMAPNQLWVADITYIPTGAATLYLAVVLDVWSRRIIGWAMATHLRTSLVVDALEMAIAQRRPDARHSSFGSRVPVHRHRVWPPLPRGARAALDGLRRRLLRQCDVRELFRDARVRTARSRDAAYPG